MLDLLGSGCAGEGHLVPAIDRNSRTFDPSLDIADGHMVPTRRQPGRRTLLDGNFARRKPPLHETEYCIWDTELEGFGDMLAELRASDNLTICSGCAVITLLLLTGCRYREILTLQWKGVKGSSLILRDSKTGPRTVWLGSAAREAIDSSPRDPKNPMLFWNYQ